MTVSIDIPTTEPEKIVAGDTAVWEKYLSKHLPSDGWALTYALVKNDHYITIAATTGDDDEHYIEIAASTTAGFDPGVYDYQSFLTKAATSERYLLGKGKIEILPNFATQTDGYDNRSHVKVTLDALEAVIANKATADQLSYSIGGRSLSRMSPDELIKWRAAYRAEYAAEERRAGRGKSNIIKSQLR